MGVLEGRRAGCLERCCVRGTLSGRSRSVRSVLKGVIPKSMPLPPSLPTLVDEAMTFSAIGSSPLPVDSPTHAASARPVSRMVAWRLLLVALFGVATIGCNRGDGERREFISVGTAPVGGAFFQVGSAISEVVNDEKGELPWRVSAESTGGSMENIRLLSQGKLQFAMSNASITYFAVRGGTGWEQSHQARSVMTLFPNVAMFVTPAESEIKTIADLKGKRVYLGPEGAGFEYFVSPILEAHGVSIDDLEARYGSQQSAVDLLGDEAIDAAMVGGGIPNPSITQMAQAQPIRMIPYGDEAKASLIEEYEFFGPASVPAGTYSGIDEEYRGLNVGSAHLITHADIDEQMVYDFTRLAYENRAKIAERHRAAASMTPENVVRQVGTEFHPGAIRYFEEIGIWPGSDSGATPESASADDPEGASADESGGGDTGDSEAGSDASGGAESL